MKRRLICGSLLAMLAWPGTAALTSCRRAKDQSGADITVGDISQIAESLSVQQTSKRGLAQPTSKRGLAQPTSKRGRGLVQSKSPTARGTVAENDRAPGLSCQPDGKLDEWEGQADVFWHSKPQRLGGSKLQARLGLASYRQGVSVAIKVQDKQHISTRAASMFGQADHVELRLAPAAPEGAEKIVGQALGVQLLLGSQRQLVSFVKPRESWREALVSAAGRSTEDGYIIEARLPLAVLAPLAEARFEKLNYEVIVHNTDAQESPAVPALRFSGQAALHPALRLPSDAPQRPSIRACLAAEKSALYSYSDGWKCVLPYYTAAVFEEDEPQAPHNEPQVEVPVALGLPRFLSAPALNDPRRRLLFINFIGAGRGLLGLFNERDELLSVLNLGIIGSRDPGNFYVRRSDAVPFKLPDGRWAVAVTHTYSGAEDLTGARCVAGHRVFLSVVALSLSAPGVPAPGVPAPGFSSSSPLRSAGLEEVFSALLEDCAGSVFNDWELSPDASAITMHNSIYPTWAPTVYSYQNGQYKQPDRS